MADSEPVVIKVMNNGPYVVEGTIHVLTADGREIDPQAKVVALCRCGQSANKPFCDGTHNRVGFKHTP